MTTLSWPTQAVVCRKEGQLHPLQFQWRLLLVPLRPDNPLQYDIAGTLGNGSWGYIVGTYDKDAGTNNQRLHLNGTPGRADERCPALDLNSAALGIGRHVSGIADPFNGHIDAFRIAVTCASL
jgi:Concanavalin A-like lectin/glucanases superfamily